MIGKIFYSRKGDSLSLSRIPEFLSVVISEVSITPQVYLATGEKEKKILLIAARLTKACKTFFFNYVALQQVVCLFLASVRFVSQHMKDKTVGYTKRQS